MSDSGFYALAAVCVVALAIAVLWALARGSVRPLPPYSKRAALRPPAELRFCKALLAAV